MNPASPPLSNTESYPTFWVSPPDEDHRDCLVVPGTIQNAYAEFLDRTEEELPGDDEPARSDAD
jgi:hypothetical protein